jgi:hypothetical protein
VYAGWVVAQIDIVTKRDRRIWGRGIWAVQQRSITEVGKLLRITKTEERVRD